MSQNTIPTHERPVKENDVPHKSPQSNKLDKIYLTELCGSCITEGSPRFLGISGSPYKCYILAETFPAWAE